MMDYPRHIRGRSQGEVQLTCCKCGAAIPPGGQHTKVLTIARNKHLCAQCEEERELRRTYGVVDRDLIERVKMYSIDYEGERE
jgi:hypothetical protein